MAAPSRLHFFFLLFPNQHLFFFVLKHFWSFNGIGFWKKNPVKDTSMYFIINISS